MIFTLYGVRQLDLPKIRNAPEPAEEFANNRVLHYYLYGLPSSHAQLATMREIPAKDDTLPEDYEAQVHSVLEGAETVWFFMLSDMPRIEQLDTFEHIMVDNYGYCGQLIDLPDLRGYIFTTNDRPGCQSEHFTEPATILTECTENIIRTQSE
jgi:hypothetical protein